MTKAELIAKKITLAEFSNFADLKIFAELFTQTLNFENIRKNAFANNVHNLLRLQFFLRKNLASVNVCVLSIIFSLNLRNKL
ncbi:hypothetical protein H0I31_00830 [Tenacibaculum sp. AHE15PA]|uniref:hypothetical protein n=1 Tax=unclassified Tenacibaculum TaxID=2635139 RepID=UPI001C4E7884|nr:MULTISPECIES: hypothetical protein [unclassified Tenacibaculum]QXP74691.1 hypothetical protein H0I30_06090 [Tenacibaculum sp. AHE14PA]QXP76202.1 hypothetical protein H0I31_00830 [Tenacibaculum sp. AHE15PA]